VYDDVVSSRIDKAGARMFAYAGQKQQEHHHHHEL
jgi:hypothetical protein